jgi:hypothetical protein
VVELSVGDVTSGLARLLAAEIEKSPYFDYRRISQVICERYTIDLRHVLSSIRKLWLLCPLVTLLPVSKAS